MSGTAGNFEGRAARLEPLLAERELTHLLVTDPLNVRYLCGFTGTNGLCLVGPDLRLFFTDFRYIERAKRELRGFELERAGHDLIEDIGRLLKARGAARLGFDDNHVTVRRHAQIAAAMPDTVDLAPAAGGVEELRAVKDGDELRAIRDAAAIATTALGSVLEHGLVGRTEGEVARSLLERVTAEGGEGVSFPTIVAAAENSAQPHAEPRAVEIPRDTLVTIDMGAQVEGYCSDMTRTLATGELPDEAELIYESTLAAQQAALGRVKAGSECRATDAAARALIEAAGYGEYFGHGLGHGVGLDVHEGPTLSGRSEGKLVVGNVVTVEPGVYLPGKFGVRIEDLVVVGDDGYENLSAYTKNLTVID